MRPKGIDSLFGRATGRCACGLKMVATNYSNSGTSFVGEACPVLVEFWGPDPHVWRQALPPHQFVWLTYPDHAMTGCCDIREVRVHP